MKATGGQVHCIGSFAQQPLVAQWAENSPFSVQGGQLKVRMANGIERWFTSMDSTDERQQADQLLMTTGDDLAGLISFESPKASDRTVVMLAASRPEGVSRIASAVRSKDLIPAVQGDLVVLKGNRLSSFRVGADTYAREDLPLATKARAYFTDKPFVLLALLLLGVVLISVALFWLLRRLTSIRLGSRRTT